MAKNVPKISNSEWRLMKILWDKSPITANEVVATLAETTEWKPKTVKTLLNRLVNKKALGFKKRGRTYHYFPLVSKTDCTQAERRSFLARIYDGSLKPMLAAFIKDEELSTEDIEELKQILERKNP